MLKCVVLGNLGSDPELRYSPSGAAYLRFNLAANYRTRAQSGEWEDRTEWVRVTVFGNRADALNGLLKRGQRVYVDGRLEARPWTDRENQIRAGLEILADNVELAGNRPDESGAPARSGTNGGQGRQQTGDDDNVPF